MVSGQTHADSILNVFRNTAYAGIATVYVSLHTTDPGATGAGEVTGGAYARQALAAATWGAPTGTAGTDRRIEYGSSVIFPEATGNWGNIAYLAIWDAVSGGNMLNSGAITTPKDVNSGSVASFAANALKTQVN